MSNEPLMDFRVDLDIFRGPMDLLLYLVRKHEVEIVDIPIAPITDQFLEYLAVLEQLDVGAVGDFLADGQPADRDQVAAGAAALRRGARRRSRTRGRSWSGGCWSTRSIATRPACWRSGAGPGSSIIPGWPTTCPAATATWPRSRSTRSSCGTWSARSGGSSATTSAAKPSSIVYDDTPIHVYMARIHARLIERGRLAFGELFEPGMHKSALVGIVPGRAGAGAPPADPGGAERALRRDLAAARSRRTPGPWTCPTSTTTNTHAARTSAR